jgi:hypothetical protein
MLRRILRGGGSLAVALMLSALFAGVALGGEPNAEVDADADLDAVIGILDGDDVLDADVDLALDAVVDLVDDKVALLEVDSDTSVDLEVDGHRPIVAADAATATAVALNLGGGHAAPHAVAGPSGHAQLAPSNRANHLLKVDGDLKADLAMLLGHAGAKFHGAEARSLTRVPIDLAVADGDHNLVHAVVGAESTNRAIVGDMLLAALDADLCIEAIIGPGGLVGCTPAETEIPDDEVASDEKNLAHAVVEATATERATVSDAFLATIGTDLCVEAIVGPGGLVGCTPADAEIPDDGDPGDGGTDDGDGPSGPTGEGGAAPGTGENGPEAAPVEPGGAAALPDTASAQPAVALVAIIGALLVLLAGAWSIRRRTMAGTARR